MESRVQNFAMSGSFAKIQLADTKDHDRIIFLEETARFYSNTRHAVLLRDPPDAEKWSVL